MRWWLLLTVAACNGSSGTDGSPGDDDDDDDDDDDTVPTECAPDTGVDVIGHQIEPIEGLPLGVDLQVSLSDDAGVWVTCTLTSAPPPWRQLVSFGTSWSYLGDGSAPASGWQELGFDDSTWDVGAGPFGFAESVMTELSPGSPTPPNASYFRRTFDVDTADATGLTVVYRRDDGIAVYINGTEVLRDNLPSGTLTVDTPALLGLSGDDEDTPVTAILDPGLLVAGTNQVAVELHQYPGSSDAGFDLQLSAAFPDETPEVHLLESAGFAKVHDLQLLGLMADATYACVAHSTCGGAADEFTVQTDSFVTEPPLLALHEGATAPGWGSYTLFNHQRACDDQEDTHRLFMVDPEGRVRWNYLLEGVRGTSTMDVESAWLGDGQILWGGGDDPDGLPQVIALDHSVIHLTDYPGATGTDYHHDVEWVDGEILGLTSTSLTPDGVDYWAGFSLVQHDPETQQITWSWNAQDAYDAGQLPVDGSGDPYHPNSLASVVDDDGAGVYLTLLTPSQIIRVDKASGDVTWKLGVGGDFSLVDASGAPLPDSEWFDGMHAIDVYGDHFLVYENGYGDGQSEVLEFSLDTANRVATLRWKWTEFGWFEPVWGDADELPNGDILVGMGHAQCIGGNASHLGALVEVDRQTSQVGWRLDFLDKDDSIYRSQRIDGCELFANSRYCPEVAQRLTELGYGD